MGAAGWEGRCKTTTTSLRTTTSFELMDWILDLNFMVSLQKWACRGSNDLFLLPTKSMHAVWRAHDLV
jgi:hypothetical protein